MITWVGYTHILKLMFFYVLRGCSCSTVIILYVMLLCCDLLWTGGVVWMSMRTRAVGPSEQQQILEIPKPITALGTVMVPCLCKLVNSRVVL